MLIDICIVSYNRPHYLSQLLESLTAQRLDSCRIGAVHLFQDGPKRRSAEIDQPKIEECVRAFQRSYPEGSVWRATENIGIVGNYEKLWEAMAMSTADAVIVFEDDLILSSHYLDVMAKLLRRAEKDPNIGLVSATGVLSTSQELRDARIRAVMPMATAWGIHRWGWGITRSTIREFLPIKRLYFSIANHVGFRDNGTPPTDDQRNPIYKFFWGMGMFQPIEMLEIDGVYDLAALNLNRVNLTTFASYARPIGREGVHYAAHLFAKRGYDNTAVAERVPDDFAWYEPARMLDVLNLIRRYHTSLNANYNATIRSFENLYPDLLPHHLVRCLYDDIFGWTVEDADLVAHGLMGYEHIGLSRKIPWRESELFDRGIDERFGLLDTGRRVEKPYPKPYAV